MVICTTWCCHPNLMRALCYGYFNLAFLHPTGTAGRSAKALRECGAPTRWAVVCRVQTCPELAEENRRNLSRGSQKDKEYILGLKEFWTDTWTESADLQETAVDVLSYYSNMDTYPNMVHKTEKRWFDVEENCFLCISGLPGFLGTVSELRLLIRPLWDM